MSNESSAIHMFLLTICLCNDVVVVVNNKTGIKEFHGQSTDEVALLEMTKKLDYNFVERTHDSIILDISHRGVNEYKILEKFDFTSDRRRMSVVVKTPSGEIYLLTKGADSAIFALLSTV